MTKEPEPGPEARDKDDGRRADSSAPSNGPRERAHCGRSHPQLVPNLTRSQSPPPPLSPAQDSSALPKKSAKEGKGKKGAREEEDGKGGEEGDGRMEMEPRPQGHFPGWAAPVEKQGVVQPGKGRGKEGSKMPLSRRKEGRRRCRPTRCASRVRP